MVVGTHFPWQSSTVLLELERNQEEGAQRPLPEEAVETVRREAEQSVVDSEEAESLTCSL